MGEEIFERKLADLRMQLAITQNPFVSDPGVLWKNLNNISTEKKEVKLDESGMNALKVMMSRAGSKMIVK